MIISPQIRSFNRHKPNISPLYLGTLEGAYVKEERKRWMEREDLLSSGYPLKAVPKHQLCSSGIGFSEVGFGRDKYRYDRKGGTYPESCLSKDDFPGKSLFETTFPVDSRFSLASL